jgi:imidazolonepropionase-like amidohydrolase
VSVLLRCGELFDGTGADPVSGAELVVDGAKIAAGPAPEGADVVDLSGCFVMPGLIDAHTHLSVVPGRGDQLGQLRQEPGRQALRVPDNLRLDLDAGTTTMRIMGEEDWLDLYTREAIEAGTLSGPSLLLATRPIAAGNGHGRMKSSFDGPDEIRRGARENLARGADFLKLFATGGVSSGTGLEHAAFSAAEMRVAVEEAERAGTYVAAHAHGGPGLMTAVEAGVRTIEHAAVASDDEVEAMLAAGCILVGTFSILFHPEGIEGGDGGNPQVLDNLKVARERVTERMERILTSGLPLALGTDSMHGQMPFEVRTAMRFGVSPKSALVAATSGGAEALRIESRTGTLRPGMDADVIALDGNPLEDPSALDRVVFVMKRGNRHDG